MEVKPGYKRSGVGVIPEDWEATKIGQIAKFTSGAGISIAALHARSSEFQVPVFGGNGIAGYTKKALVTGPTVIVGRVGQKCGTVLLSETDAWVTDNALYPQRLLRPAEVRFLALALERAGLNDVRNRNDLPLVTQSIVHAVGVAWPPELSEQRAIADALSDLDALIHRLDQLIDKKRGIKNAAMQRLLPGRMRLPGFQGEWFETTWGGAVSLEYGIGLRNYTKEPNGFKVFGSNGPVGWTPQPLVHGPGVVLGRKGGGGVYFSAEPFTVIDTAYYVLPRIPMDPRWLYYAIDHYRLGDIKDSSPVPSTSRADVYVRRLTVPQLNEQQAIAKVLFDMDAELIALAARRDKTHALKQGMMQELLTGKTRLVATGGAND